jgi:BD-FAE protein
LIGARGTGPTDQGARVDLVVSFSGPMDLRPLVNTDDPELREAVRDFLGCASGPCPDASEASPITHVDPTDPPMALINGNDEIIPVDQAQGMARALQDAGVQSKVWIVQGGHGAGYGGGDKVLDLIIPYVEAWVEGRQAPTPAEGVGATGSSGKGQEQEQPAGSSGTGSPGKGSGGQPTPATQPPDAKSSDVSGRSVEPAETIDAVAIAAAMIALLLVVVLVVVVLRLRRRLAGLTAGDAPRSSGVEKA